MRHRRWMLKFDPKFIVSSRKQKAVSGSPAMQLAKTSKNSEEFLGPCDSENFQGHLSSLWVPARSSHSCPNGPLDRVAAATNGGWRVSLVMCLPAVGIITDLSKRRFNIFILLVTLTHLLLVSIAHFSAPGSLPSATNRSTPINRNLHIRLGNSKNKHLQHVVMTSSASWKMRTGWSIWLLKLSLQIFWAQNVHELTRVGQCPN